MAGLKTVTKFGVPVFSTGGDPGKIGLLQPKPKYRFRVRVINFGDNQNVEDLTRQVVSVSKPKLSFNTQEFHSYNSIGYYAGKHQWSTINLVLRDDISNRATRLVGQQVQKQFNHFEQTGFVAGVNYTFDMYIEILDGGNVKVLEEWFLEGCFLTDIDWDSLDYSASDPIQISLTIRAQNAQYAGEDGVDRSVFPLVPFNNIAGTTGKTIA
jgi:hypothetical protein